jgi:uncharacterized membrane protein YeaQ/YmgE (transglycosylase-associated protein family)
MEWIVIWAICGFIAMIVMGNKGRSGVSGCLLGFLLGPLGLIIAFVLPSNQNELDQRAVGRGTMKQCPFCAEPIRMEAAVCRYCGRDLPVLTSDEEAEMASDIDRIAHQMTGLDAKDTAAAFAPLIIVGILVALAVWWFS